MPPDPRGLFTNLLNALLGRNRPGGTPEQSVALPTQQVSAAPPNPFGFTQDLGTLRFADLLERTLEGPFVQDTLVPVFGGTPTVGVATRTPERFEDQLLGVSAFVDPTQPSRVHFVPQGRLFQPQTSMRLTQTLTHEFVHSRINQLAQEDEATAQFVQDMRAIHEDVVPKRLNDFDNPPLPLQEAFRSEAEHLGYTVEAAVSLIRARDGMNEEQLENALRTADENLPGTKRAFEFLQSRLDRTNG